MADQPNLKVLQHNPDVINPRHEDFDYAKEVSRSTSTPCGPTSSGDEDVSRLVACDFGHYGPFFIRMSWHAAGTYRVQDGPRRGGQRMQRFAPLNSWPDNANLDKGPPAAVAGEEEARQSCRGRSAGVRRQRGPRRYGVQDFRLRLRPRGRVGGRGGLLGPEASWLAGDKRYTGKRDLENPLAAVQMGLIYVNPEGPDGHPDPLASAIDIRETFGRMAMNDVETAALIVGGHTFGKTHGVGIPHWWAGPEAARWSSRTWAGRTSTGPASAKTPPPAAWRSSGPTPDQVG